MPVPKSSSEKLHPIARIRSMNFLASFRLEIALVSVISKHTDPGGIWWHANSSASKALSL